MKNKVINISDLTAEERAAVRAGKSLGLKNTFIIDEERGTLWGYTREGEWHCTNAAMAEVAARYEWYVDGDGEIVTDDIPVRTHIRMAALVIAMAFCGRLTAEWGIDGDGKEPDLAMLKYIY